MTKDEETRKIIALYELADEKDRPRYIEDIYKIHEGFLVSFLRRIVFNRDNYDDFYNEAFIILKNCVDNFNVNNGCNFVTYLAQALRFGYSHYLASNRLVRMAETYSLDEQVKEDNNHEPILPLSHDNVFNLIENKDKISRIFKIAKEILPEELISLLYDKMILEKTYNELSDKYGVTTQALGQRLEKALRTIKENIDRPTGGRKRLVSLVKTIEFEREKKLPKGTNLYEKGDIVKINDNVIFICNKKYIGKTGKIIAINCCLNLHKKSENCYLVKFGDNLNIHFEEIELDKTNQIFFLGEIAKKEIPKTPLKPIIEQKQVIVETKKEDYIFDGESHNALACG